MQSHKLAKLKHILKDGALYFITSAVKERRRLPPEARRIVVESIQHFADIRYMLFVAVVMPDHFHALLMPLKDDEGEFYKIPGIVQSIKGFSGRKINSALGRRGALWQQGYYDRIIRGEKDLAKTWTYTLENPVRAGLSDRWADYPFLWTSGMG